MQRRQRTAPKNHRGRRWRDADVVIAGAILALVLALGGCVNTLAQNAPGALRAAETRARFELNCQNVQSTILSQKTIQAFRFEGSEYTIGVRGCGRQIVYVTYCRDANDCNALSQTGRIGEVPNPAPGTVP